MSSGLHPRLLAPLNSGATEHPHSIRSPRPQLRKVFPSPITARPSAPRRGPSEVTLVPAPPPWPWGLRGRALSGSRPIVQAGSLAAPGCPPTSFRSRGFVDTSPRAGQQKKTRTSGTASNRKLRHHGGKHRQNGRAHRVRGLRVPSDEGATGVHRRAGGCQGDGDGQTSSAP